MDLTLDELASRVKAITDDKGEISNVVHHCIAELHKVDRIFKWKHFFENMTTIGVIDEDEASRNYCAGLTEFHDNMLSEVREFEASDLSFLPPPTGKIDQTIFHDDLVIGTCLLNDVSCFDCENLKIIKLLGGCMLRKYKHDHDVAKLQKMGDVSHLFDDPIDIVERENAPNFMAPQRQLSEEDRPSAQEPEKTSSICTEESISVDNTESTGEGGSGEGGNDRTVEEDRGE